MYDTQNKYEVTEFDRGVVNAINGWYKNNEMKIIIVEGYTGVGKSLYSLLIASQVYNTKCWNDLKKYYVYSRDEFLHIVKNKRVRSPLLVWDDAGNWLHSNDFKKPDVVSVCKYFQVARPHWACIMLTTVDAEDIVSRIRNLKARVLIQIIKHSDLKHPDRRTAKVYTRWKSPDKTRKGEETQILEDFSLHWCDQNLYKNYEVYRNSFVKKAIKEL